MSESLNTNRHPADQLAQVRREIDLLQQQERLLRQRLIDGEDRTGDEYRAEVSEHARRKLLPLGEIESVVPQELLERITKSVTSTYVYVKPIARPGRNG